MLTVVDINIVRLSALLNVILLSVILQNFCLLCLIILSVISLNIVLLNAVMLGGIHRSVWLSVILLNARIELVEQIRIKNLKISLFHPKQNQDYSSDIKVSSIQPKIMRPSVS